MTTRADVVRLNRVSDRIVGLAKSDLVRLFASFDLSRPELVREALVEFVPDLVREYGEIAATAAAEWYEEIRATQVGGSYYARLGQSAPLGAVEGSARYSARHLFGDDPQATLKVLQGAIGRHILYSVRGTVLDNADRDSSRPRYARVPSGAKTCAFCMMLASRGFTYRSEATAGMFDEYHDDCNCQVVPEWDKERHHIEGYDPDKMYEKYVVAREAANSSDPKLILAEMRRMFPGSVKDGVF